MSIDTTNSERLWVRAQLCYPDGASTTSKSPRRFPSGFPKYLRSAYGAYCVDVDGNEFVDTILGLGAILLGHCHPPVRDAGIAQAMRFDVGSLPHELEVIAAETIRRITCQQSVRYFLNGRDPNEAAVRLARAATGREHWVFNGYHGCHDLYAATQPRQGGVLCCLKALGQQVPEGDLVALEAGLQANPIAAVVLEQSGIDPPSGYYAGVRKLCDRYGAILIMDEVVTGLRFGPGGACARYGIAADIVCMGKAMCNGWPLSAIAGKHELVGRLSDDPLEPNLTLPERSFMSMTFGGWAPALARFLEVVNQIENTDALQTLRAAGTQWIAGAKQLITANGLDGVIEMIGHPERSALRFSPGQPADLLRSIVQQAGAEHGVLFGCTFFVTPYHAGQPVEQMLVALGVGLDRIKSGLKNDCLAGMLVGEAGQSVIIGRRG